MKKKTYCGHVRDLVGGHFILDVKNNLIVLQLKY